MAWTKAKTAIVTGAAAIFTAALVIPTVSHIHRQSNSQSATANFSGAITVSSPEGPKTPDEATKAIFDAWGNGDWNAFYDKFGEPGVSRAKYDELFTQKIKDYLQGMEVLSLGKPTNSFGPNMWFVPYKIRFRDGSEKEFRLHVAQDPRTRRWIFKGGF